MQQTQLYGTRNWTDNALANWPSISPVSKLLYLQIQSAESIFGRYKKGRGMVFDAVTNALFENAYRRAR